MFFGQWWPWKKRHKPNACSKTTTPCDCGWFARVMSEPGIPIQFDAELNEYHLIYHDDEGERILYHCPFCGGTLPESKRAQFFTEPSRKELDRLSNLTDSLQTVEEILQKLGTPELDHTIPEELREMYCKYGIYPARSLTYTNLSETTTVHFNIDDSGNVEASFGGKYIGPPRAE